MANDRNEALSGRDLQASQAGGASGAYDGSNRDQRQSQPEGGGPAEADLDAAGGSSGAGGYGSSQDVVNQRDEQPEAGGAERRDGEASQRSGQSRGERFDEEQGGGRGVMFDSRGGVSESGENVDAAGAQASDFNRDA